MTHQGRSGLLAVGQPAAAEHFGRARRERASRTLVSNTVATAGRRAVATRSSARDACPGGPAAQEPLKRAHQDVERLEDELLAYEEDKKRLIAVKDAGPGAGRDAADPPSVLPFVR